MPHCTANLLKASPKGEGFHPSPSGTLTRYESGMGMPVGLFPCPTGVTVNVVRAIEILSGASAIPIASGGLGGAEGAVTLLLKGKAYEVKKALDFVGQSKGARLPDLRLCNCNDCPVPNCRFPMVRKHA
jgi:hypothetical protein